jgi:hypothetical protein
MSWRSLISIYREAEDEAEASESQPPTACPNDGQPLRSGPRGELHCDFDGWVWQG